MKNAWCVISEYSSEIFACKNRRVYRYCSESYLIPKFTKDRMRSMGGGGFLGTVLRMKCSFLCIS